MTAIDVSEADFQREVIERSRTMPVVVDFWAPWCGPCRELGPLLESAARAREGKVTLAKLDTDANQGLARAFEIKGIPAVKAFREERVVQQFVGAQPRATVERFFDTLLPSEADELIEIGTEEGLRRALELEPGRADAAVALARLLLLSERPEQAGEVLEDVAGFQADGLRARLRLEQKEELADALQALDAGETERGLGLLLDGLAVANGDREDVRRIIVGELDVLGVDSPTARAVRRRLAAALY